MTSQEARTILRDALFEDFILSDEYQDRYYLKEQILEAFPHLAEGAVYRAIDNANEAVAAPRKAADYIETLVKQFEWDD
ncbi:MAG: hypothetical protein GF419_04360 [Ignavibacteriales bacterium]|nr:hypothetical protein [Ignavibacteriales bacterium]